MLTVFVDIRRLIKYNGKDWNFLILLGIPAEVTDIMSGRYLGTVRAVKDSDDAPDFILIQEEGWSAPLLHYYFITKPRDVRS